MTNTKLNGSSYVRFGGELPRGCDILLKRRSPEPANSLFFSNARAALSWFIRSRGPFDGAIISAYTCPSVPTFLENLDLPINYFDHGLADESVLPVESDGRWLALIPTTFGLAPFLDAETLAHRLPSGSAVIVDAAQTAFGHLDFGVPSGGAVVSCPRKTLALADGCVMALDRLTASEISDHDGLPSADASIEAKREARELLARRDTRLEMAALRLVKSAEANWPLVPHRMSRQSRAALSRIDREHHHARRRANYQRLRRHLGPYRAIPDERAGTPYCFPILANDRNAVLQRLHEQRIFASPLWPDAKHSSIDHPIAADFVRRLISLPVDQRYDAADMDEMADRVLRSL